MPPLSSNIHLYILPTAGCTIHSLLSFGCLFLCFISDKSISLATVVCICDLTKSRELSLISHSLAVFANIVSAQPLSNFTFRSKFCEPPGTVSAVDIGPLATDIAKDSSNQHLGQAGEGGVYLAGVQQASLDGGVDSPGCCDGNGQGVPPEGD